MPCILCSHIEKGADEENSYMCGGCVSLIGSKERDQIREMVDKLYLANKVPQAEFIERFLTGFIHNGGINHPKLKVRKVEFRGLKPNIKQSLIIRRCQDIS